MGGSVSVTKMKFTSTQKKHYLKSSVLFANLTEDQLERLSRCFIARSVKAGTKIPYSDQEVMVVGQGEIRVEVLAPAAGRAKVDQQLFLCNKKAGDILNPAATKKRAEDPEQAKIFGMLSELQMVAVEPCVVLDLKRPLLEAAVGGEPALAAAVGPLLGAHVVDHLRRLDLLASISEAKLHLLGEMCKYEMVDEDTEVFRQGARGDKFYVISTGSCEVQLDDPAAAAGNKEGGRKTSVFLGDLLPNFDALGSPKNDHRRGSAAKLMEKFCCMTSQQLGPPQLQVDKDNKLCNQNKSRSLSTGSAGGRILTTLGAGDYFGETGLLLAIPRTSTVVAREKSLLVTCERTAFHNFLLVAPGVREVLMAGMVRRLLAGFRHVQLPYLRPFKEHQMAQVASLCTLHEHKAGAVVCEAGQQRPALQIIVYGTLLLRVPRPGGGGGGGPEGAGDEGGGGSSGGSGGGGALAGHPRRASAKLPPVAAAAAERRASAGSASSSVAPADGGGGEGDGGAGTVCVEVRAGNFFGQESLDESGRLQTRAAAVTDCVLLQVPREVEDCLLTAEATASWRLLTRRDRCSLHDVLNNFQGFEAMRRLLESEFSGENLRFLRVAQKYRKISAEDPGLRPTALAIVDEYIRAGAPSQLEFGQLGDSVKKALLHVKTSGAGEVNIDAKMREAIIQEATESKKMPLWLFDRATKEVYNLVEKDGFKRFLRTDHFKQVLDGLGARRNLAAVGQPNTTPSQTPAAASPPRNKRGGSGHHSAAASSSCLATKGTGEVRGAVQTASMGGTR